MVLVHKPGKDNTAPDAISRLLPEVTVCTTSDPYNHIKIAKLQHEDRELQKLITHLETGEEYQFNIPSEIAAGNAKDFFLDKNGVLHKLTVPSEPHQTIGHIESAQEKDNAGLRRPLSSWPHRTRIGYNTSIGGHF